MNTFLFAALIGGTILLVGLTFEQLRLRRHRGASRVEFVRYFDGTAIPELIPETVYDYYKSTAVSTHFGISPDDSYEGVLRKGDEEIDSDARFLVKQLGFRMPTDESLARRDAHIREVRDMVIWLDWVRTQQHD